MAKISVIIPIYNVEKYIQRCAQSLFSQTFADLEYIFIDDCTPDNSIEILKNTIEKYPHRKEQIRIVKMPTNSGLAAVRRHGISIADGDFIIHCDSDDWIEPDMYERMYETAIRENCDIVSCGYFKGNELNFKIVSIEEDRKKDYLTGPIWNRLVKKEIVKNPNIIHPIYDKAEDGTLMIQYCALSNKRSIIDIPLYHYFTNPKSICNSNSKENCISKCQQEVENIQVVEQFLKNKGIDCESLNILLYFKYDARKQLLPHIVDKDVRMLWKNTFPELDKNFKIVRYLDKKGAVSYFLIRLGLNKIAQKFINKF